MMPIFVSPQRWRVVTAAVTVMSGKCRLGSRYCAKFFSNHFSKNFADSENVCCCDTSKQNPCQLPNLPARKI
jgi:hypothetical protein